MGKGSFNFQATLKLNSSEFKKGVKDVQRTLQGLQKSFLGFASALGAGLGFTQLISNIRKTATELSVAMNTLKNVSTISKNTGIKDITIELNNYGEMLTYVKRISQTYSQDLVAVTENFAQFHAACNKTNLSLENQKLVFEALTRAAATYHMSADRAKDMMNAVTQMMSKGKVAAEELRRQLGNSLPGAFNLMAAALDVSTSKLDDMMKKGQIISEEALPKFAAMLNQVTKNADFDSLQLSINKLKNAWYELVTNSDVETFYKRIIDGSANVVHYVSSNIKGILGTVLSVFNSIISYKFFNKLISGIDNTKKHWIKSFDEIEARNNELQKALGSTVGSTTAKGGTAYNVINQSKVSKLIGSGKEQEAQKYIDQVREYNENLIQLNKTQAKIKGKGFISRKDINEIREYNKSLITLSTNGSKVASSATFLGKSLGWLRSGLQAIKATIASMGIVALISFVIGAITKVITRIQDARKEAERIKNITKEYVDGYELAQKKAGEEEILLRNNYAIAKDEKNTTVARVNALKEINKQLGLTGKNTLTLKDLNSKVKGELNGIAGEYDKVILKVEKWIEATKKQTSIQYQANKQLEAQNRIVELEQSVSQAKNRLKDKGVYKELKWGDNYEDITPMRMQGGIARNWSKAWNNQINQDFSTVSNGIREMRQYRQVIIASETELKKLGAELSDIYSNNSLGEDGGGNDKSNLEKVSDVYNDYINKVKALKIEEDKGLITSQAANEELKRITTSAFKAMLAFGDLTEYLKKYPNELKKFNDFNEKITKEFSLYKAFDEIDERSKKAFKKAEENAKKSFNKMLSYWKEFIGQDLSMPVNEPSRDTRLDYQLYNNDTQNYSSSLYEQNLSDLESYINKLENLNDWLIKLKIQYGTLDKATQGLFDNVQGELTNALSKSISMKDLVAVTKWKEDLKEAQLTLKETKFDAWTNAATSLDRVASGIKGMVDAWKSLGELDDPGMWDYLQAAFTTINEIVQVIQTVKSVIEGVQAVTKATSALAIVKGQTELANLSEQIALKGALTAADVAEGEAAVGAEVAKATAAKITSIALKDAAAGAAAANAMMVPYPANLAALTTNMAAITAAFAAMKGISVFAKGGIVEGNSTVGDKNVIRANSGEMVLTKGQQGTLFNMLNGKGGMGSGDVQFIIRGSDLVGTLNNYSKKIKG